MSGAQPTIDSAGPPAQVTVVVITHDESRWAHLSQAIDSLANQIPHDLIIGVDNNPALAERVRQAWPSARVVSNTGERGASSNRNTAAAAATTEFIAFLDDDVVAHPGWLSALVDAMSDPDTVGAGGAVEPIWEGTAPRWMPDEFGWVLGYSFTGQPTERARVRNVWGGTMIVRRDVFEAVGGFRDGFGKVGGRSRPEDTDFCIRMASSSPKAHWVLEPQAVIGHQVPLSRATLGYFIWRCYAEGQGKVEMRDLHTGDDVLGAEQHYLTQTIPAGVRSRLRRARAGDVDAVRQAAMIGAGIASAGVGAVVSTVTPKLRRTPPAATTATTVAAVSPVAADAGAPTLADLEAPVGVGEVDLNSGPEAWPIGEGYAWARILPRRGYAIGEPVIVPVRDGWVRLADVAAQCSSWTPDATQVAAPPVPQGLTAAITIGTRNRPDQLRRMLASLSKVPGDFQVLVVDNAPSDQATENVVLEMKQADPRITYIFEPRPGLSVARNRALRECTADVLLFTDDDVEVDRHWVELHLAALADPSVWVSTGPAFAARLDTRDEILSEVTIAWSKGTRARRFSLADPPADIPIFPFSPGSMGGGLNFAVRVEAARTIGGFDETLGAGAPLRGGEDCDFMIRAVRRGGTVQYSPRAFVWHHHRHEPGDFDRQRRDSAVGLGAYLSKLAVEPAAVRLALSRAPAGVRHLSSLRQKAADAGVSSDQRSSELGDMVSGAWRYHVERRRVRRAGGHVADSPLRG